MGYVYFIQHDVPDGLIKIGKTGNPPAERLRTIRCWSPVPLRLLGFLDCAFRGGDEHRLELGLHAKYAEHRRHGEWFAAVPELVEFASRADEIPAADVARYLKLGESFVRAQLSSLSEPVGLRGSPRWRRPEIVELAAVVREEHLRRALAPALKSNVLRAEIADLVLAHLASATTADRDLAVPKIMRAEALAREGVA